MFLDSSFSLYTISKHKYFIFDKEDISSLSYYFQYCKSHFFSNSDLKVSETRIDAFNQFIQSKIPNQYWKQFNLKYQKISQDLPLLSESEFKICSINILENIFVEKYNNLQFDFDDSFKLLIRTINNNINLKKKFHIFSSFEKLNDNVNLYSKNNDNKILFLETYQNFSYIIFSSFVEKFFEYINTYFDKNLQIFQEQFHIENLEKLADYCILNNDVNINHFKTHKNHKI